MKNMIKNNKISTNKSSKTTDLSEYKLLIALYLLCHYLKPKSNNTQSQSIRLCEIGMLERSFCIT